MNAFFRPIEGEEGCYEVLHHDKGKYYSPNVHKGAYRGKKVWATGDRVQIVEPVHLGSDVRGTEDLPRGTDVYFLVATNRPDAADTLRTM